MIFNITINEADGPVFSDNQRATRNHKMKISSPGFPAILETVEVIQTYKFEMKVETFFYLAVKRN